MITNSNDNRSYDKSYRDYEYEQQQEHLNQQKNNRIDNNNNYGGSNFEPIRPSGANVVPPPSSRDVEYGDISRIHSDVDYIDQMDLIVRHGFIRKVMSVVFIQLLVTFGAIALFNLNDDVKDYMDVDTGHGLPIFWTSFAISLICIIALTCCADQARTHPNNVIFLSLFTIAESVLLGIACAAYDIEAIILAVGATSVVVFGLVLYASQSSVDFTGMGPYLFMSLWILVIYGMIFAFIQSETADILYSIIGVILFSFYLVYDVQLIIGGKHNRYRFSIDDWVFAALNVYLDIINLFIRILELISKLQKDN